MNLSANTSRITRNLLVAFCAGLVLAVTALSQALAGLAAQALAEKPSALRGRQLYAENCAACHGDTGLGDGPTLRGLEVTAPSFTEESYLRENSPAALFEIVTNGRMDRFMPPWKDRLSSDQIWDAVFYTWWLGTPAKRLSRGADVYDANCAGCHGAEGRGDGPEAASLTTPPPDFTALSRMMALSQQDLFQAADGVADHPGWADLPEDDRWAALDYVRTFSYEPAGVIRDTFDGIIAGELVNGTETAIHPDLSGVMVSLFPVVDDSVQAPITTTTGPDGSFRFEGLGTGTNRQYDLSARYQGIDYFADDLLRFTAPGQVLTTTVTVYETTSDPDAIVLDRSHLILDFSGSDAIDVAELHIFLNTTDRTYVGEVVPESSGRPVTLRFGLPAGATNLRFQDPRMETSVIRTDSGFLDTLPVLPGGRQVLFSYRVPYSPPRFHFARQMEYTSNNLNVLVRDVGVKVTVPGLTEGEPREVGSGVRYLNFVGRNVVKGQELVVQFEGTPQLATETTAGEAATTGPAGGLGQDLLRWVAVALALVAGAGAIGYAVARGRPAAPVEVESREDLEALRQELLLALARLDDAYEAGQLREADYQEERALTKAQLVEVMRRLRAADEGSE